MWLLWKRHYYIRLTMREIPKRYKDSAVGKALKEAQETFLKASQELLTANRTASAGNYADTNEVQENASALLEAEERMKAAEAAFDLVTDGPEPVPLTDAVRRKVLQSFPSNKGQKSADCWRETAPTTFPSATMTPPKLLNEYVLAVLKVADGSEAELRKQIDAAKRDWRDVINAAEYPEAARLGLLEYSKLDGMAC